MPNIPAQIIARLTGVTGNEIGPAVKELNLDFSDGENLGQTLKAFRIGFGTQNNEETVDLLGVAPLIPDHHGGF